MKLIIICGALFLSASGQQESTAGPDHQATTETSIPPLDSTGLRRILSNDTIDPSIYLGQRAQPGEIPWQAFVLYGPGGCGGSLIDPLWVLTAGHCIEGPNARQEVRMGSTNTFQMPYRQRSVRSIVHPQYNPITFENDVALVRLPVPASGPGIAVIALAPHDVGDLNGVFMQASGFGSSVYGRPNVPDLYKASLRGITNAECRMTSRFVVPTTLCANWNDVRGQSACSGDSGGPLAVVGNGRPPMLVGVFSFVSSQGCNAAAPQGFARVSAFRTWIERTMAQSG